jgi:hypothetical protein
MEAEEVDPIAEADVYMAYGRDAQAEEILKEALQKDASRIPVHAKLLEIYAKRNDTRAFEQTALKLKSLTNGSGADWDKAAALGRSIDPGNGLYGAGSAAGAMAAAPAAAAFAGAAAAAPSIDFDIARHRRDWSPTSRSAQDGHAFDHRLRPRRGQHAQQPEPARSRRDHRGYRLQPRRGAHEEAGTGVRSGACGG